MLVHEKKQPKLEHLDCQLHSSRAFCQPIHPKSSEYPPGHVLIRDDTGREALITLAVRDGMGAGKLVVLNLLRKYAQLNDGESLCKFLDLGFRVGNSDDSTLIEIRNSVRDDSEGSKMIHTMLTRVEMDPEIHWRANSGRVYWGLSA